MQWTVGSRAPAMLWAFLLAMLLAGTAFAQPSTVRLSVGDRRADVEAVMGPPQTQMAMGARAVLTYPPSVRVEFQDGVLIKVTGGEPSPDGGWIVPLTRADRARLPWDGQGPVEVSRRQVEAAAERVAGPGVQVRPIERQEFDPEQAGRAPETSAVQILSDHLAQDEKAREEAARGPAGPAPMQERIIGWALEMILSMLLSGLTMWLVFRFTELDTTFTGFWMIVFLDVVFRYTILITAELMWDAPTLFHLERGVVCFLMMPVVNYFSINRNVFVAMRACLSVNVVAGVIEGFALMMLVKAIIDLTAQFGGG